MAKYQDVIIAGFGGQGVMLIGNLLAQAGMEHGLEVSFIPVYGAEMRGGTANCTVVLDEHPVGSPLVNTPRSIIVLNEPSVVALDKNTGKLLKVGADAQAMLGRTPGNIIAIRPLREGVISDYEVTERMIKEFLHKVMGFQLFKPRIIICVPSGITEVEERAVIDAGIQAGARRVYLIEEPVAAAIGAGIDITQPEGHMIIDIGGGTSDIAVISLSGVVESSSIKIAGDQFNEAVV